MNSPFFIKSSGEIGVDHQYSQDWLDLLMSSTARCKYVPCYDDDVPIVTLEVILFVFMARLCASWQYYHLPSTSISLWHLWCLMSGLVHIQACHQSVLSPHHTRASLRGCGACSTRNSGAPIQIYIFCYATPHFPSGERENSLRKLNEELLITLGGCEEKEGNIL